MQEIRFPFYARLTFILLIIVLIIYLLTIGKGIFVPLLKRDFIQGKNGLH